MLGFLTEFVPKYLPRLLRGALVTLELTFVSMAVSTVIGVVLRRAASQTDRRAQGVPSASMSKSAATFR